MPVVDDPDLVDLEYADDTLLFLQYILDTIRYAFDIYCVASGARIYWHKSFGILLGSEEIPTRWFHLVTVWTCMHIPGVPGRSGCFPEPAGLSCHAVYAQKFVLLVIAASFTSGLCSSGQPGTLGVGMIQSEGVTLQAEFRSALQAALLVSAKRYSTGPPQLLTQICLALSALVLRAVELKKPVEKLFASLSEIQGHGVGSHAILELLTVLPEEVIEENVVNATVNSERRWHFTQELLSHTGIVLEFLLKQTKDDTISKLEVQEKHKKVLRSLLSWVRVGCFLEIPQSNVASHPLLGFVFDSLQAPALFDLAVEVIVELVSRHEVNFMVSHGLKLCALFRVLNIPGVNSIPG
ncbi:hypothetical protein L7F22_033781 [Adiantum nelumboides]|nr:hypothetical protein [Adiantum nelumboides]